MIETTARSYERGIELKRAHKKWGVSIRTIQRWVSSFEAAEGSVSSFARAQQSNAGRRRVWVSRIFDRVYLADERRDPALLPALQAKVDQLIRAAWSSPAQRAGWRQVGREVVTAFARHLIQVGISMPEGALTLSQRRIRESRYFRIVDIRAHDRKTYDDQRPRIRRANDRFLPMQQIVMDVKVVDCALTRDDGTVAWPRMIAFMDMGTQRVFRRFFLLKASEAIRQEHVATVFVEMISDPLWGFPQQLYRDNGSEFFILDMIRSALDQLQDQKARTIINARPYSAASKPVESRFATLDRFVFSQMQGWTGGDRMRKKTAHLGRPPVPYPGTFGEFINEADERICVFENTPIGGGPFAGKTAPLLLAEHVARGWRPLLIPAERVDAAFCTHETRRVSRGNLKIAGATYRHPNLVTGQTVNVALPWRREGMPLAFIAGTGWVHLEREIPFAPDSIEGSCASNRLRREHDLAVSQLKAIAGKIDLEANRLDRLKSVSM
ncbi:MAG: hypothetical protein WBA55_04570, partial [Allopontixanthobacter sediminis]